MIKFGISCSLIIINMELVTLSIPLTVEFGLSCPHIATSLESVTVDSDILERWTLDFFIPSCFS